LVVHGEPGVGKTALLEYAGEAAREFRVVQTVGVEGEMELPYAALQQLCSPILELTERLPMPQGDALAVAFGLSAGAPPSPFLVGLAALGRLSEASQERPLLCVVDDAQWLDRASARSLAFVARRLLAEKIAFMCAAREFGDTLAGLPELRVELLGRRDARTLLESVLPAPVDEHVLDRIVLETHGNPLALMELPRGMTPIQLAGGFGLPAVPLSTSIEESFTRRLAKLPGDARRLLLIAAADPTGDPAVVWRAARQLGIPESIAETVEAEDLLELGVRVVFRHPLVRSAVYRAAGLKERRAVHRVLAEATDPQVDPDRRAWHRAQAASMPDENVAAELERSAGRAQARGGLAAVAAFLERAAALTPQPAHRAQRLLAAACANRDAGAPETALGLLAGLEASLLDELGRARVEVLRGQIASEQRRGGEAGRLLLSAARLLEPLDPELARETYLEALAGAMSSDVEVVGGATAVAQVAQAARAAPTGTAPPRTVDVLLDAFAIRLTDGYAAAAPALARALQLLLADISNKDVGRLSVSNSRDSNIVALEMWDDEAVHRLAARQVQVARDAGALVHLQFALSFLARSHMLAGELTAATLMIDEARLIAEATGNPALVNAPMILAAFRGHEAQASELIEATSEEAAARRWTSNNYARSVLYNGLGRHDAARDAAWEAMQPDPIGYGAYLIGELAEAASRTGDRALLEYALEWLSERTGAISSEWATGIEARVRALLSEGEVAESLYRESIAHLSGPRVRLELARTHLLYGEWLRRERRRLDARKHLRIALEAFTSMGTEAFAGRAERELLATGEHARKRTVDTLDQLTPQEEQVARLAAKGATNREIAAQLFISPSTVEYHLRKAFRKLDVKSRTQLAHRIS
jgi:DNA-binding CsgD family transcriptional regulator